MDASLPASLWLTKISSKHILTTLNITQVAQIQTEKYLEIKAKTFISKILLFFLSHKATVKVGPGNYQKATVLRSAAELA